MKLTKANILFFGIIAFIIILVICFFVRDLAIPLIVAILSVFGIAVKKSDRLKNINKKEKAAFDKADRVKKDIKENQAQESNLEERAKDFNSRSEARRRGLLSIIIFMVIAVGAVRAADLVIPKDYNALKALYIEADQELKEASDIIKGYQELSAKKDQQIADLIKANEELKGAAQDKDKLIESQDRKISTLKDQAKRSRYAWGPSVGFELNQGFSIGLFRKNDFWGWGINATPAGSLLGNVTLWLP